MSIDKLFSSIDLTQVTTVIIISNKAYDYTVLLTMSSTHYLQSHRFDFNILSIDRIVHHESVHKNINNIQPETGV